MRGFAPRRQQLDADATRASCGAASTVRRSATIALGVSQGVRDYASVESECDADGQGEFAVGDDGARTRRDTATIEPSMAEAHAERQCPVTCVRCRVCADCGGS